MNKPAYTGAYSRRFSNKTSTDAGQGNYQNGSATNYRVITTANDRSMGDVAIKLLSTPVPTGQFVAEQKPKDNPQLSRFTPTAGTVYQSGTRIRLVATPNRGCEFVSWADGVTSASRDVTVNRDMTFKAIFKKTAVPTGGNDAQNLTANIKWDGSMGRVNGNGLVYGNGTPASSASITAAQGSTVTLTAEARDGFHFVKWTGGPTNGTEKTNTYMFQMNNNYNIKAVFEADDNGHGDVTDDEKPVDNDGEVPSGGGGGGNTWGTASGSETETGTGTIGGQTKGFDLKAFVKKWWWAILIVAYVVYKEWKGGAK
ncbi:MAG: hypothetical protein K6A94_12060 [Bacteroidales bacterium]|nr:hypothetical protein [Bacteroidales bacterium]